MESDPKKLALLLIGKNGGKAPESDGETDDDTGASSSGPDAFAEAVKLAMKGDKAAAFQALKVAVSACEDEDY